MMRPKTSEPGMRTTHPNPAGETDADYEDDAEDYEYEADEQDDEEDDEEEEDEEEEEVGNTERSLRLTCAFCGETNRARPPRGYEFAEDEDAEDAEPRQIRYRCAACGEVNRRRLRLVVVSEAVRTFRESYYGRQE